MGTHVEFLAEDALHGTMRVLGGLCAADDVKQTLVQDSSVLQDVADSYAVMGRTMGTHCV